jgi:DUF4097 and DUF4098 domain-containing protein YvlB
VQLEDVRGPLTAGTSNGSVRVRLAPEASAPFTIRTSNGNVDVKVGSAFGGVLDASTSNGGVNVRGAKVMEQSKSRAKCQFGTGDALSVISTSNGSIDISGPE